MWLCSARCHQHDGVAVSSMQQHLRTRKLPGHVLTEGSGCVHSRRSKKLHEKQSVRQQSTTACLLDSSVCTARCHTDILKFCKGLKQHAARFSGSI